MPELSQKRRYLILAICCLSLLIVGMDATIVNVALPSLRVDLHASVSGLQWIVDAYTLVLASLLVLSGSTADRLGRRRTFQTGLVLFTGGSLLCSLAPSLGWLIAFRMVQAVGGSMLNPVAMSIITNVFTEPRERARAIGMWSGVIGLSFGLGPVVGGLLVQTIGWRAIFWINVPIGVLAFVLAALFVPESKAPYARRPDPIGQALVIVVLGTVTYSIIEAPRAGWVSLQIETLLIVAVVALVAFLRYEARRKEPLIELKFFRSAPFSGATLVAVGVFSAFSGFLFLVTLYLQDIRHLSALDAGLMLLPMAAVQVIVAPQSGRLVAAKGARLPLSIAGVGTCRRRRPAGWDGPDHLVRADHGRLRHLRLRVRPGQRADHQHGGVGHAPRPGRRRRGHRVHQPPDRRDPGRGRGRLDPGRRQHRFDRRAVRRGRPHRVVGDRRIGGGRGRHRRGQHRRVGPPHRRGRGRTTSRRPRARLSATPA